jgi:hypothetical protein
MRSWPSVPTAASYLIYLEDGQGKEQLIAETTGKPGGNI